jgi:rhomboid protease GluP
MSPLASRGTPVTLFLLIAIGLVFVLETVRGGSTNPEVLVALGANHPALVLAEGEWWRLVASMFLHIGFAHLLLNGWALFQLGALVETLLGSLRLLIVYFVSGIAGSLASIFFTQQLSAGASGAIFGLLGVLISFLLRRRDMLTPAAKSLLGQLVLWAGINVVFGFINPGIDNSAHLGGFAAGFLLGFILRERQRVHPATYPGTGA